MCHLATHTHTRTWLRCYPSVYLKFVWFLTEKRSRYGQEPSNNQSEEWEELPLCHLPLTGTLASPGPLCLCMQNKASKSFFWVFYSFTVLHKSILFGETVLLARYRTPGYYLEPQGTCFSINWLVCIRNSRVLTAGLLMCCTNDSLNTCSTVSHVHISKVQYQHSVWL